MVKLVYFSDLTKGYLEIIKKGPFTFLSITDKDSEKEVRASLTLNAETIKELKDYL
jgi:hypothetical protein